MARRVGISPRRYLKKRLRDDPWFEDVPPGRERRFHIAYFGLLTLGVFGGAAMFVLIERLT
jgi:hypothetical protein